MKSLSRQSRPPYTKRKEPGAIPNSLPIILLLIRPTFWGQIISTVFFIFIYTDDYNIFHISFYLFSYSLYYSAFAFGEVAHARHSESLLSLYSRLIATFKIRRWKPKEDKPCSNWSRVLRVGCDRQGLPMAQSNLRSENIKGI